MKANDIKELIETHDWLIGIVANYTQKRKALESYGKHLCISKVSFVCCSDKEEQFEFNSHRTISPLPFLNAIDQTIDGIKEEIKGIEDILPNIEFETKLL